MNERVKNVKPGRQLARHEPTAFGLVVTLLNLRITGGCNCEQRISSSNEDTKLPC